MTGSTAVEAEPEFAGIVSRGCAFALDVVILQAILFAVGAVITLIAEAFGEVSIDVSAFEVVLGAIAWAIAFNAYLIGFWWLAGQTPGMRILGIEVRTTGGTRVTPSRGIVRAAGMILAAIPLFAGYVPILLNERRQGLHDKLADTLVLYRRPAPARV